MEVMVMDGDICFPVCNGDSDLVEVNFDGISETCLLLVPCHHPENAEDIESKQEKLN